MKKILFAALFVASIGAINSLTVENLRAATSTFSPPVSQGTVTASGIVEASGMVASPDNAGVLWVENDSGNPNSIFAIDTSGHLLGTYYLDGVTNYDWEDMSVGPGPVPGVQYLYLANSASRVAANQSIVVRVPEPTVYASQQVGSPPTIHLSGTQSQTFSWTAPDAESMFVDRQTGDIYLGSKQSGSAPIYKFTQPAQWGGPVVSGTQVASVVMSKANGASISPNGSEILLRSQNSPAYLYHRSSSQTIAQTLNLTNYGTNPDFITINNKDVEPNAEIIAFDSDGVDFYTFSEGTNQKLYKYTRTTSDGPNRHTSLVSAASTWKYLDGGAAPAAGWQQSSFNDSSWPSNSGPFGYGQGGEHAVLSYGGDPNNKAASDVFRTTFNVANPHLLTQLTLKVLADDGDAVYLNGTQIDRFNLSADATLSDFAQSAISNDLQNNWRSVTFDRNLLVPGLNTLAIEVHGASATDNDLRFDAQISALPVTPTAGDFNLDGHLNASDITAMLSAIGDINSYESTNGLTQAQGNTIADVNHDGVINNADMQYFLNLVRNGGGSSDPVPEPATILIALSAFLSLVAIRRGKKSAESLTNS